MIGEFCVDERVKRGQVVGGRAQPKSNPLEEVRLVC